MAERIRLQAQMYGFERRFDSCPLRLGEIDSFEDAIALLQAMVSLDETLRYQCHAATYPSNDNLSSVFELKSLIVVGEYGYMACEVTDEKDPRVLVTASENYSEILKTLPADSAETFYLYASLIVTGLPVQGFVKAVDAQISAREVTDVKTSPAVQSLITSIDKGLNIAIERLEFAHIRFNAKRPDSNSSPKKAGRKALRPGLTKHLRELDIND